MSVRCGHCSTRESKVNHDSVAEVRACYAEGEMAEAYYAEQAIAEIEAEARNERWFESGGAVSEVIAWENEQDRLMHPFDPQVEGSFEVTPAGIRREVRGGAVSLTPADIACSPGDPCDYRTYHRCNAHRAQDAAFSGNWRDRFRSYCD